MDRRTAFTIGWLLAAGTCGCTQTSRLAPAGLSGEDRPARQIDLQQIVATAQQKVYPALVYVKPIQETFHSGERQRAEVFGSGVIISPDGFVVTNHHVAEKAIEINCVLGDREQVPATVVGLDPETDLALLKLRLPAGHAPLPAAEFADSDAVRAGQFVLALGSPYGFTRSISLGIISNTQRYIGFTTQYAYNLWLQTDAAINPGNSGGPLVNTEGRVVGINTLGMGLAEGIGFAIPANIVRDVVERLKTAASQADPEQWPVKIGRAYLGVQLQALNDFSTSTFTDSSRGVLVESVERDSPAEAAGVRNGDLLLAVNGQPVDGAYVEDLPGIRRRLADLPVDKPAGILVARKEIEPVAASRPATALGDTRPAATRAAGEGTAMAPASSPAAAAAEALAPWAGRIGPRCILMLTATPIARGKFEGADFDCRRWNMTVKELTKFSNPLLHFLQPAGGVFIQGVREPGNAADAGLQINDILLKIGKTEVKTIEDVRKAYESLVGDKTRTDKKVLITIKRGGFLDWKPLSWEKDYLRED